MKFTRILIAVLAVMVVVSGCTSRERKDLKSDASRIESGFEDDFDDKSRNESSESSLMDDSESSSMEEFSSTPSEDSAQSSSSSEDESQSSSSEESEEPSKAAMSTDFSEIGTLSSKMDNGFPGGPVDERNRPSGPISYQEKYGKYDALFIVPDSNKIYLTFDEGYENGYTAQILDVLKEKGVKAVFFITYPYAKGEPELVKRMVDEGHVLGNHSTAHKNFTTISLDEAAQDIMKLHDYVKAQYGYEMYLFRPPEGAFSEQTLALAKQLGYKSMLWSFAYKDYDVNNQPITIEATNKIISKAHPGEICLLHAVSKTNADILDDVIDSLRNKGFVFADYFNI